MDIKDFKVGERFCVGDLTFATTDIGSRTVAAVLIDDLVVREANANGGMARMLSADEAEKRGMFSGPPYFATEIVINEEMQAQARSQQTAL